MTSTAMFANHGTDSLGGIIVWALFLTFPALVIMPGLLFLIAFVLRHHWGLRRTGIMVVVGVAVTLIVPPLLVAIGPEPDWDKGWRQAIFPNGATISLSLFAYAVAVSYANRAPDVRSPR